jgi:hypothetical protein
MSITLRRIAPLVVFMTVAASSQTATSNQAVKQYVRSIEILPIASSSEGLPENGVRISLAHIPIVVGSTMAPDALVGAIERADKAIQSAYEGLGSSVRVEHETSALGHNSLAIRFRVIELCSCNR